MCIIYLNLPIVILGRSETLVFGLNISIAGTVGDAELPTGRITAGEPLVG